MLLRPHGAPTRKQQAVVQYRSVKKSVQCGNGTQRKTGLSANKLTTTTNISTKAESAEPTQRHHFMHAPLEVCSVKRRHQSPEWTILSHVDCFIPGEVIRFQVLQDSLYPRGMRQSWWSPPVLQGKLLRSSWHPFHLAFTLGEMVCYYNS